MPPINTSGQQWKNAVAISQIALNDGWASPVVGALFFHAKYVSPGWKLKRLGSIDQHIFYR
jgi:N-acetylmuramoyl-L-alanine amidase